jgi:uncharacterized membrane protein/protein-disulfide isomerase
MSITSLDRAHLYPEPTPLVRPLVLWVMRLAALVAAGVSGYISFIMWRALTGTGTVGCSGGFDCDAVLNSGWSTWFGLPVSILGLTLYLSLLCTLAFSGPLAPENVRRTAWAISLALCALAGAAALWFLGLQLFVLGKFCSWCLTIHVCGLGAALLAMAAGRNSAAQFRGAAAVAAGGLALLVVGQMFGPHTESPRLKRVAALNESPAIPRNAPPTVTTQRLTLDDLYADIDKPPTSTPPEKKNEPTLPPRDDNATPPSLDDLSLAPAQRRSDESIAAEESPGPALPSRVVSLFRGSAQVDVYQHPVLGSPEAPHVIVKLFDYTCGHCRAMHEHLQQAREVFGGDLAVVMCPVPLNKQCNPHVQSNSPKHAEACELARIALAVWQDDPTKFDEFDSWLFAPATPPSAASARLKAVELVGEAKLTKELYSDQLRQRLAIGPKLYQLVGAGTVPKLLLPTGMLVGPGESGEGVTQELKKEFAPQPDVAAP